MLLRTLKINITIIFLIVFSISSSFANSTKNNNITQYTPKDVDTLVQTLQDPVKLNELIRTLKIMEQAEIIKNQNSTNVIAALKTTIDILFKKLKESFKTSFLDSKDVFENTSYDMFFSGLYSAELDFLSYAIELFTVIGITTLFYIILNRLHIKFKFKHFRFYNQPIFLIFLNIVAIIVKNISDDDSIMLIATIFSLSIFSFLNTYIKIYFKKPTNKETGESLKKYYYFKKIHILNVLSAIVSILIFFLILIDNSLLSEQDSYYIGYFGIFTLIALVTRIYFMYRKKIKSKILSYHFVKNNHALEYIINNISVYTHYIFFIYICVFSLYAFLWGTHGVLDFLFDTVLTIIVLSLITFIYVLIINARYFWTLDKLEEEDLEAIKEMERKRSLWNKRAFTSYLLISFIAIIIVWGFFVFEFIFSIIGNKNNSLIIYITLNIISILIIWFGISSYIIRKINKLEIEDESRANRLKSLYPLIMQLLAVAIIMYLIFAILKSFNLNIVTLITSFGAISVVIGIIAQKELQNFFAALNFLVSNHISVNDNIKIGEFSGRVEKIGVRNIFLRDSEGNFSIIPFSSIGSITHRNKEFSMAIVTIRIDSSIKISDVTKIMLATADTVLKKASIKKNVLSKMEIMSYEFVDMGIVIKARVKTISGKQSEVRLTLQEEIQNELLNNNIECNKYRS